MWKLILLLLVVIQVTCGAEGLIFKGSKMRIERGNNVDNCVKSVEDLFVISFHAHPSIQSSRQVLKAADAQVEGARWNYFPTPSVDMSRTSGKTGSTIRLDQPLWTGGKLDATYDGAISQKKVSEFGLEESGYVLVGTLLRVLQNYAQAEGNVKALEDGLEQLTVLEAMLERRIDAGVSSIADHELIKSRLTQISTDLTVAKSKLKISHSQLELLLGSTYECSVDFSNESFLRQNENINQTIDSMLTTNPVLKKISAQIETAKSETSKAKAIMWPNVSLRAERQSGSVYTEESVTNNLVYISVQMSPGAGLSAMSSIQASEAKVLQLEYEKLTKQQELTDEILKDFDDYHAALDRIDGTHKTINSSQKVLDSYTRLFIAGKRQWLDLVNASRELTQNKMALSDLRATLLVSSYRLALQKGKIKLLSGENE